MKNRNLLRCLVLSAAVFVGCKPEAKPGATQASASSSKVNPKISEKLDAIRQAGYPVTVAELEQWIPSPPPDQNAATKYTEAFATLVRPPANAPRLPARTVRLPAATRIAFAALVATNKAVLDQLQQATVLTQSCYPIQWDKGFDAQLPHLASIKAAAQVVQMQAALLAESTRSDLAADSVRTIVSLARSLDQEPLLISQLVRISVLGIAHTSAERLLNQQRLPEALLAGLQSAFRNAERNDDLVRALATERCMVIQMFKSPSSESEQMFSIGAPTGSSPFGQAGIAEYLKNHGEEDLSFYLDLMEKAVEAAKQPFPQCLTSYGAFTAALEQDKQSTQASAHVVTAMLIPSLNRAAEKSAENAARLRTAQTAIAVERYRVAHAGQLPTDLAALVPSQLSAVPDDPFTGKPLLFKPLAKGYVVYSVGRDGKDDGGKERVAGAAGDSGFDVTFIVER